MQIYNKKEVNDQQLMVNTLCDFLIANSKSQIPSLKFQVSNFKSLFTRLIKPWLSLVYALGFGYWNLGLGIFVNVQFCTPVLREEVIVMLTTISIFAMIFDF